MKISYIWLKDYVDFRLIPEELAKRLTLAGLEVTSLQRFGKDSIFEIEPTPNRPDTLSVIGIAREVAAITGAKLKAKGYRQKVRNTHPISIKIEDNKACPLYTARIIDGVKVGHSPDWMRNRLELVGCRSVNNIVDITNYVCLEIGQPLHAFDYEKIETELIVRRARKGEKILAIDNKEYILDDSELLIADAARPLAIAGVIGGKDSEVTHKTGKVILESAYFDPLIVRRASRRLKLSTESSYRFERGVDLNMVEMASKRAASLILDLAGGKLIGLGAQGSGPVARKKITIILNAKRVNQILGTDISIATTNDILKRLEFKPIIHKRADNVLKVSIPSFRRDITQEIDLIEELARIYGYDRLPVKLPNICFSFIPQEKIQTLKHLVRNTLTGFGFNEAITYSLLSSHTISIYGYDATKVLKLANPLSGDQESLRPSIIPGAVNTVAYNMNRQIEGPKLFELGKVFSNNGGAITENTHLAIALEGRDFFYLKGVIQALFASLRISDYHLAQGELLHLSSGTCSIINVHNKSVGSIGRLSKRIIEAIDLKKDIYVCEVCIDDILPAVNLERRFSKLPRYPAQRRDISLEIDEGISYERIAHLIKEEGSTVIKDIRLFDYYKGPQIQPGKKSMAFSIEYRSCDNTLTDDEVSNVHRRICSRLTDELKARIR